ncbi:UDP-glucose/GDP-mannose dehydrogenase family protein [Brevibacillus sp. SYP-B805]|uniref:UDP-glucose dehydrogenase family protein n=1 Tax=Brevibacillus sp. SYP-B805 TaxID=1578199 RepID=UPI0013ECCE83|nr:UDP-glucose/GDP-mannose dehydrogenase family protein [Brevibacillus sp. SYP-B805]NGQ97311.1 UDP-glucose/GDP-mannose dehydrogenase family protein [Brevibacillus sp. SYP-B805]
MKITVIGTGYVGLTTAVSFAMRGHSVMGVDVDAAKVERLQRGQSPIYEPGLEPALQKAMEEGGLTFTANPAEAVARADALFLCVGTPEGQDGRADLGYLFKAVATLQELLPKEGGERLVVIKSTVPVGTSDQIAGMFAAYSNVHVVTNPEFLREGRALQDSLEPSRIVIGARDERAFALMEDVYADIDAPRIHTTRANAEMIKYASNAFLATRISFMNELARLCAAVGADIEVVARGMGLDSRIGPEFLRAGVGFGGSCFPKDIEALINLARATQTPLSLLEQVRAINRSQPAWFLDRMRNCLQTFAGKEIALLGLSFKPETDDIREAPSLVIVKRLLAEGAHVRAYDPVAVPHVVRLFPELTFVNTAYDALEGADAAILVTEWKECTQLDWLWVKVIMAGTFLFDGRNAWPAEHVKGLGFTYLGVGRS